MDLLFNMCVLYVGLQVLDHFFDIKGKELAIGSVVLSAIIATFCFIEKFSIAGLVWVLVALIDYTNFNKNFK